jgi:hypothetical protein
MCDAIGHPVDRLRRTRIGAISDRGMRPGQIRDLTPAEITSLMAAKSPAREAGAPGPRPKPSRSTRARPSPRRD